MANLGLLQTPTVVFKGLSTILRDSRILSCYSSSGGHIAASVFNSPETPDGETANGSFCVLDLQFSLEEYDEGQISSYLSDLLTNYLVTVNFSDDSAFCL